MPIKGNKYPLKTRNVRGGRRMSMEDRTMHALDDVIFFMYEARWRKMNVHNGFPQRINYICGGQ